MPRGCKPPNVLSLYCFINNFGSCGWREFGECAKRGSGASGPNQFVSAGQGLSCIITKGCKKKDVRALVLLAFGRVAPLGPICDRGGTNPAE